MVERDLLPAFSELEDAQPPREDDREVRARVPLPQEVVVTGETDDRPGGEELLDHRGWGRLQEGKTREEVYQYFIAQYGSQEPLGAPIDKGFNRLAWFFPYLVGASGALAVVFVARKWAARKDDDLPSAAGVTEDPAMRSRLDDELRDLD